MNITFNGEMYSLRITRYMQFSNTCLQLIASDGSPFARATINLEYHLPDGIVAIKDYAENEGIMQALEGAGAIEFTGEIIPVGYAECYLCKLLIKAE